MDGRTDGRMDRQTDRQIDQHVSLLLSPLPMYKILSTFLDPAAFAPAGISKYFTTGDSGFCGSAVHRALVTRSLTLVTVDKH